MALHLEQGRLKEAAACFARYVDALTGPFPTLDQDLFSRAFPPPARGARHRLREYRQLLLASVQGGRSLCPLVGGARLCRRPCKASG